MKSPLRVRYFFWLLSVLLLFLIIQVGAHIVYEVVEHDYSSNSDELVEEIIEISLIFAVGIAMMPVMMLFMWGISKRMMKPLKDISSAAERISSGHLDERIQAQRSDDELGMLADAINNAFDRYEEAVQRMSRFSSDASHQLRTPLTAIRSTGEVCLQKPRDASAYQETIGSMLEEVERLSRIVDKLLLLARLDAAKVAAKFKTVKLAPIVDAVMQQYATFYIDKNIEIDMALDDALTVDGDAELLHQAIANLVDNAIRHTPKRGTISIRLKKNGAGDAVLTIADTGPGIPEDKREHIFERFAHIPTPGHTGSGLGLAIVSDIVRAHKGKILCQASPSGGARFSVTIPTSFTPAYAI